MTHRQLLAGPLVALICSCAFGDAQPRRLCDPGGLFREGRVIVAFGDQVNGPEEAREIVEDEGYEVELFLRMSPPHARIIVPPGQECAVMLDLQDHPLVEFTALSITIYAR